MDDDPRVSMAALRTHLANERTYAAWLRTGLSLAAAGLAVPRLNLVESAGAGSRLELAIGAALVSIGALLIAAAAWSYVRVQSSLSRSGPPPVAATRPIILLLSLLLTGLLLASLLFL